MLGRYDDTDRKMDMMKNDTCRSTSIQIYSELQYKYELVAILPRKQQKQVQYASGHLPISINCEWTSELA